MNEPGDIKYFRRNTPYLDKDEVREAARTHFGLQGEFLELESERDQNFTVSGENGEKHVLRIANAIEDFDVIDFQTKALEHIASRDPSLPVPRTVANLQGEPLSKISFSDGQQHLVRVLTYLPGQPLRELMGNIGPEPYRALGATMARLDMAMRGFFHPAADHDHPWNMGKCLRFAPFTRHFESPEGRMIVGTVFDRFKSDVLPRIASLRHQVIHQDAHGGNALVDPSDPETITGIIDFGDMAFGSITAEVAVAVDAVGVGSNNLITAICETTAGFDAVLPLEEAEIDCVFDMILMRTALAATISTSRAVLIPDEAAYVEKPELYLPVLDHLLTVGRNEMTRQLRKACRFAAVGACLAGPAYSESEENELIDARRRLLGEKTKHFYSRPLHFERARGAFLFGTDGLRYLDCYNNVPQVGHCNPHVVTAISRQAAALNTNTRYLYGSVIEYAERVTAKLAPHLDACVFVNSGSEANDVAWQMAKLVTGNDGAILMEDGYHGVTEAIRPFSPGHPDTELPDYLRGILAPDPYRGPYGDGDDDIAIKYAADAERAITELAKAGHGLAAFMIDSAFCSSGVPDVPEGYLKEVEKHVRAAGGLMICDEVQSGFGRMGQWWGHELHGVKADFVTMGKPVANGHPFGVVVTTSAILNDFIDKTGFFSTFGGNTVACAAANAVMDVIERDQLIPNGVEVGDYMRQQLQQLAETQDLIGDIRGHGMLTGLEFVSDRETREPATMEVAKLLELMRERQILVGKEGRFDNILKLRPPLVFGKKHVDLLVNGLDDALKQL